MSAAKALCGRNASPSAKGSTTFNFTCTDTKPDMDHSTTTPPSGRDTTVSPNNDEKESLIKSANTKVIKMNYLHVPHCYNPKVYELNDDIILQYETETNSEDEVKFKCEQQIKVL